MILVALNALDELCALCLTVSDLYIELLLNLIAFLEDVFPAIPHRVHQLVIKPHVLGLLTAPGFLSTLDNIGLVLDNANFAVAFLDDVEAFRYLTSLQHLLAHLECLTLELVSNWQH